MRLVPYAPCSQATQSRNDLKWRHGHRTLSDSNGDSLAGIPFLPRQTQLPLTGWHRPLSLIRQVNAGLPPYSGEVSVLGDVIYPKPVAHVVEVHVAGLRNGSM